jgi:hypothetical protein
MSDSMIFIVGTLTFLLLSGGLGFTILEVRRLDEQAKVKRRSSGPQLPISQADTN